MENFEPQHADVMAALRDLHQHQAFTDFTIQLKDGPVHVSKILIAALSLIFRSMLIEVMTKTRTNSVVIGHITMEIWTCITEFYFGRQKLVTIDNVVDVLEASHMYELDTLTQYCCDYLQSVCSPDNCLAIKRMAAKLQLEAVVRKASEVIAQNFSTVCKCEDFLFLEKTELLELLDREKLVTTEDDVCEALLVWMEAKDADADTSTDLFQHVRFRRLSSEYLGSRVLHHRAVLQTPALLPKVQQENLRRLRQSQYRRDVAELRRCDLRCDRDLIVVGECDGRMQLYSWSCDEKWLLCPTVWDELGYCFSSSMLGHTIVATGGFQNNHSYLYDWKTRSLSQGPALLTPRNLHGMTVIKNKVYVVAGNAFGQMSSIEELAVGDSQWSLTGNLKVSTDECGVTSLGNTILVAGGDTDEGQSLIQMFNVETRTAAVLNVRLPRPMRHVRAARLGNTTFFVGREGDLVQITEVKGQFQMTSHVQLQGFGNKKWFGLHVTDTCVRVIGGDRTQSVVCWNHQGQKLEDDEVEDLPEEMRVHSVHEVDYSFP